MHRPGIRAILVTTCTLVSYFHGNNDGQKGVGLALVVLMAFMPIHFALNPAMTNENLTQSIRKIEAVLLQPTGAPETDASHLTLAKAATTVAAMIDTTDRTNKEGTFMIRKEVQGLYKKMDVALKGGVVTGEQAKIIKSELKSLNQSYEFSPTWVVAMIAICLGIGTMIGWKRIVVTIGEKIGKSHLNYAQGASAELCAAAVIGVSSASGLPVSTTHVLSSGIAGTMVAQGGISNLQKKTVKNIALAWILTLPVTMVLSALLFLLFRLFA